MGRHDRQPNPRRDKGQGAIDLIGLVDDMYSDPPRRKPFGRVLVAVELGAHDKGFAIEIRTRGDVFVREPVARRNCEDKRFSQQRDAFELVKTPVQNCNHGVDLVFFQGVQQLLRKAVRDYYSDVWMRMAKGAEQIRDMTIRQ